MPMKMQARLIKGLAVRVAVDRSRSGASGLAERMGRLTLGDLSLADARELAKEAVLFSSV
jgi:hypothetical protein